jgi:hypothetical protein
MIFKIDQKSRRRTIAAKSDFDGCSPLVADPAGYVSFEGDRWFQVKDSHLIPDFFTTPISSSDHWMFASSNGALTAGRGCADNSLFPYYSADKLQDTAETSGSLTLIRVTEADGSHTIWRPFSSSLSKIGITRNVYKNVSGNRLAFEETSEQLGLTLRAQWTFSEKFGFVRTVELIGNTDAPKSIAIIDGLQNLMPCGISKEFQLHYSNLGDAYKSHDLLPKTQLGLFYLSSVPTDKAEPSEGLKCTTVWSTGLDSPQVLLSEHQLSSFVNSGKVNQESRLRGCRGAYLVNSEFVLLGRQSKRWQMVADISQSHGDVAKLNQTLEQSSPEELLQLISDDVADGQHRLDSLACAADGLQTSNDVRRTHRHQSNVIYNLMRGGMPLENYQIDIADFQRYVGVRNKPASQKHHAAIAALGEKTSLANLHAFVDHTEDSDLMRLGKEYLPFTFSRRHGDPSRPWNKFSIQTKNEDGSAKLAYEGNWRDIFQNWEAVAVSWPKYTTSMIRRFVNASTADGYNPYRINQDGVDWESPSEDEFSNIGYWGDHQIIYLLKLLEWSRRTDLAATNKLLTETNCSYVNVPYRIAGYEQMLIDPCETISFDHQLNKSIDEAVLHDGTDAKLHRDQNGKVIHVSMLEKLLLPAITKMTNFVPGGGIWMNTQRPEWNDANNALVGRGVSVVTACYLRRYFAFLKAWFEQFADSNTDFHFTVSEGLWKLADKVNDILAGVATDVFYDGDNGELRKQTMDALGAAGSRFRQSIYRNGVGNSKTPITVLDCLPLIDQCLRHLDDCISNNRRSDGLFHTYNLISITDDAVSRQSLYEMLEGQVAAISSGAISSETCCEVLDSLRQSSLYRPDQESYVLYPDRQLNSFMDKNVVDPQQVQRSKLLQAMLESEDQTIVENDCDGQLRFNANFSNVDCLNRALTDLQRNSDYYELVAQERSLVGEIFETTFQHHSFTGRSGTFFAYEGLGSIYWHMVSKLSLAIIERQIEAAENGDMESAKQLHDHYIQVREGLGLKKTPAHFGAFPTDPYSHTPSHAGAQQPGMTGQVKEDVLSRMLELGVRVQAGIASFNPSLFEPEEFAKHETALNFIPSDAVESDHPVDDSLPSGCFGWSWCQTPITYRQSSETKLELTLADGQVVSRNSLSLSPEETRQLFDRAGGINKIDVYFQPSIF